MKYTKPQIKDSLQRVRKFIKTNNRRPNTVKLANQTVKINDYLKLPELVDGRNRINKFIKGQGRYPNTVNLETVIYDMKDYRILYNIPVVTNKVTPNSVATHFFKVFGNCKDIKECLKKIENHGYSYYYNDKFTNKTSIDRMKAKKGINCTDACHVFYWLCKYFNLPVECIHVQCKTGGHVRLRYKQNGKWVNIDPACVLSTGNNLGIHGIWCPNAPIKAINPSWWKNDIDK